MLCKVQVGVGYSKGALWVDNSKAFDKESIHIGTTIQY